MGRTPIIGTVIREFLPWHQLLAYLEAVLRVYNELGRRDNIWKARIKMIVKALGTEFTDRVEAEFAEILEHDGDGVAPLISQAEYERVASHFALPEGVRADLPDTPPPVAGDAPPAYRRWLERNLHAHRLPGYRAVTLSLKRAGQAPGDVTDAQMEAAAALADRYSAGELRVTHQQNLVLPWVRTGDLPALWQAARAAGFATPNIGLLTDIIACPGGDFCALANAKSIPVALAIQERVEEKRDALDYLFDIGELDLNISGCMNACGHHHVGHIGILGVDKNGEEWYQIEIGGNQAPASLGKVIGPSVARADVPDVVEKLIARYLELRDSESERFIDVVQRVGIEPFKESVYGRPDQKPADRLREPELA